MNSAIGHFPLAIASGITQEHADCFLVANGIGLDFRNLDPQKTRDLVDRVRAYG